MIEWRSPGRDEPVPNADDECAFCSARGAAVPLTLSAGGDDDGVLRFDGAAVACSRCAPLVRDRNWTWLGARRAEVARSAVASGPGLRSHIEPLSRESFVDFSIDVCALIGGNVLAVGAG